MRVGLLDTDVWSADPVAVLTEFIESCGGDVRSSWRRFDGDVGVATLRFWAGRSIIEHSPRDGLAVAAGARWIAYSWFEAGLYLYLDDTDDLFLRVLRELGPVRGDIDNWLGRLLVLAVSAQLEQDEENARYHDEPWEWTMLELAAITARCLDITRSPASRAAATLLRTSAGISMEEAADRTGIGVHRWRHFETRLTSELGDDTLAAIAEGFRLAPGRVQGAVEDRQPIPTVRHQLRCRAHGGPAGLLKVIDEPLWWTYLPVRPETGGASVAETGVNVECETCERQFTVGRGVLYVRETTPFINGLPRQRPRTLARYVML